MKKIAFILALVMVFAVALVACDETPADNSTPAAESSVNEDIENTESSAPEASEEDEASVAPEASKEDEVSEPEVVVLPVGDLLTLNLAYTTSEQFRMGGADVGWGWDPNAAICYPDEEGKSLTDGVIDPGDSDYTNAVWAGFNHGTPTYLEQGYNAITFDLGESKTIAKTAIYLATSALQNGIGAANTTIEVFVSDDGENWTSIGTAEATDDPAVNYVEVALEASGTGRYVEVRVVRGGWAFISEVEVYAAAE